MGEYLTSRLRTSASLVNYTFANPIEKQMDVDTLRVMCAVHCDEIEVDWIKYDRRKAASAHIVIHERSVTRFLEQLRRVMGSGHVEAMEGAESFYVWCKLPYER